MQDDDRQTQEAFDAVTGEAMALTPPRVEDQALSPRSEAGRGLEPLELARPSFESALERFRSAGQTDVNPDDPALFNAYRRSLDYLGDMALGGLDLSDAAFRAAVGITAQALPENQERSFARDLAAMPEAFMGYSPGRIQTATDRVAEGVAQVGRNLNQPGSMPTTGIFGGNLAADFGRQADGQRLPTSVGAEGLPRFEIDDSAARYNPQNLAEINFPGGRLDTVDWGMVNTYPGRFFPTLDQVIDHPELFRQYPELAKVNIVIDTSLPQTDKGYYYPNGNLIAVSRETADDSDLFAETLLHEIQHDVQKREGFDQGTNPESDIVGRRQASQISQSPEAEEDIRYLGYYGKSGEVESRNVGDRKYLTLEERFETPPIRTESVNRGSQWIVDESGNIKDAVNLFGTDEENRGGFLRRLGNLLRGRRGSQYNAGGVVSMEEQMSLFEVGGLADDGAMRDPVSGNEVPPGSMASEVRDDVPAMLSEGEYIVPADVVRFFGVKFFEDLRSQAKSGLNDMEQNGRIGGEPVPGPEGELSPEEMAMLAEITGMAVGGDVRRPAEKRMSVGEALANMSIYEAINSPGIIWTPEGAEATTPEMKRELFKNMGLIQIAEESGDQTTRAFQEGGVVTQQDFMNQAQQAEGFRLPSSVFAPSTPTTQPTAPFTPVTLYGPTGDTMLATSQEQYNSLIAQGYTTQPVVVQPPAQTGGNDGGGGGGGFDDLEAAGGGFKLSDENFESLRNNPLAFGTEALGEELPLGASTRQVAGALSMVAGPVGMIAGGLGGAAFELDNIAKARAALKVAESQGLAGTAEYTALETSLRTAEENLTGPARLLERLGLGSGNSYINQYEEFTSTTPATPAAARPPTGGGRVGSTPRPATDPFAGMSGQDLLPPARDSDSSDTVFAPTSSPRPTSRPSDSQLSSAGQASKAAAEAKNEQRAKDRAESASVSGRVGPMAKGGLVAKPSRKKPVAKKK